MPSSALRDLLQKAVAEFNKSANKSWRIKEEVRKLIYSLIRCPDELLTILKDVNDKSRWEHGAFTLDNLEGDYFVPGSLLSPQARPPWQNYKVGAQYYNYIYTNILSPLCAKTNFSLFIYCARP